MNAVTRMPSASVNRSCAPGCGRSLRRISRVPAGHADMSRRSVASATHAVADLTVRLDRRVPGLTAVEGVGRVWHPGVDRVAQREPDPMGSAGCGERVGGPSGVGPHQRLRRPGIPTRTPARRQRRQRLLEDRDVIGRGVAARVAGPQQPGQRLAPGDLRTIRKRQQRVMAERLLPGRRRVLLVVGVVDGQCGVDVDMQPPAGAWGPPRRPTPPPWPPRGQRAPAARWIASIR